MSRVVLVQAWPRDAATGAVVPVRLAGGGSRGFTHRGFDDWLDGVVGEPRFTAAFGWEEGGWTGGATPKTGAIGFSPASIETADRLAALVWPGAELLVEAGDDADADPAWATLMRGTVAGLTVQPAGLSFTFRDMAGALALPLAPDTFAGTGGLEGGADAAGRVKRRSWGRVFNVEGRLLVKASNIHEFGDPGRQLAGLPVVKDKGRAASAYVDVAWQGSAAATLAALSAAAPPRGGCARAPSIACVKWWTEPAGPLTADLLGENAGGYVETVAGIAARVVAARSALPVTGGAQADASRADPAGLHVDASGDTAAAALNRLLLDASLLWSLTPAGAVELLPIDLAAPVELVDFESVEREAAFGPVSAVTVGYQLNQRVHSDGEISAAVLAADVVFPDGATGEQVQAIAAGAASTALVAKETADAAKGAADIAALAIPVLRVATLDTAAAQRQAARDGAVLEEALLRLLADADRTRRVFRDAGITVDPATGVVRLSALDQVAERTSEVEIALDATRAAVALRATTNYVAEQIALAQLPGQTVDLSGILSRLGEAEIELDGLAATVALKASAVTLTQLGGTVTGLSQTLDALAGTVETKATTTVVGQIDTRVGSVEQTISTLGDVSGIATTIRQARLAADGAAQAALAGILGEDAGNRRQLVAAAEARQELFTKLGDDLSAEAARREGVAARVGAAEAAVSAERDARVAADQSRARAIEQVDAALGGVAASVASLNEALVTPAGGTAKAVLRLTAGGLVSGTVQTNDGQTSAFKVAAQQFSVEDENGNRLFYVDADGAIAAKFKQSAIGYNELAMGSASKASYTFIEQDVVIARGTSMVVASHTFNKEDTDSLLEVSVSADCSCPDDLQFTSIFLLDGVTRKSAPVNITLADKSSRGAMPIHPFACLVGVSAGSHTVNFVATNNENNNVALTVAAGSILKVNELRKASIGSVTGSGATVITPAPSSSPTPTSPSGGGGGGGSGGGYRGGLAIP